MWNITKTNHLLQELYFILRHSHDSLQSSSSRLVDYFFYFFSSSGKNPAHDTERSKTSHLKNHTYGLSKLCKSLRFENETTLEPWKWNSLHLHEIMAINLFIFYGWSMAGEGGETICTADVWGQVRRSYAVLLLPSLAAAAFSGLLAVSPAAILQQAWKARAPGAADSPQLGALPLSH